MAFDFGTGEIRDFDIPGAEIFLAIGVTLAVAALVLCILMWELSKKSVVLLIMAEIIFVFDTLGLLVVALAFGAFSFIGDFIVCVAMPVILGIGICMGFKRKMLGRAEKERARRHLLMKSREMKAGKSRGADAFGE